MLRQGCKQWLDRGLELNQPAKHFVVLAYAESRCFRVGLDPCSVTRSARDASQNIQKFHSFFFHRNPPSKMILTFLAYSPPARVVVSCRDAASILRLKEARP